MSSPASFKLLKEVSNKEFFFAVARVPESTRLVVGAGNGSVYEVDPLAEKPEFREIKGHESYVTGVGLVGETLLSVAYDGKLLWQKLDSGEIVRTVDAHSKWIRKLAISPSGTRVATVGDDMACRIWEIETGKLVFELKGHAERTPNHFPSMLYACGFSPDGRWLATADRVGRIVVWDADNGAKVHELDAPLCYTWDAKQRIHSIGGVRSVAFSTDSQLLAIGGMGQVGNIDHLEGPNRLEVFALADGKKVHEFSGDAKGLLETLAFHPQGEWLLACGGDNGGVIQFYDLAAKKIVRTEKFGTHLHACLLNETADRLFAVGHGKIGVWEIGKAEAVKE